MSHFKEISKKAEKALEDLEKYTKDSFIYRYGIVTSQQEEARLLAWFHGATEKEVLWKANKLDKKFHKYTDTLRQIEYLPEEDTWYCTYAILYPFDKSFEESADSGQKTHPLF